MTPNLPVLAVHDGRPMADTRDIARTFDKKHQHVLEAYRNLHCSDGFRQSNFRPIKIKDLRGESTSHVLMTKNGFSFLVLGFTGWAAAAFKEQYVARFDAMEEELRKQVIPAYVAHAIPQTYAEALEAAAALARENDRQRVEIADLRPARAALAVIAETDGSFCIRDAAKLLGLAERVFRGFLQTDRWIYRRDGLSPWIARADRLTQGWMTTKVIPVETSHGKPWNRPQARITCAGLVVLAKRLGKPVPPEAQGNLFLPAPARA